LDSENILKIFCLSPKVWGKRAVKETRARKEVHFFVSEVDFWKILYPPESLKIASKHAFL